MATRSGPRKSSPKGGRPSKLRPEKVARVEEMKACGQSNDAIAAKLGISRPTLEKHYATALSRGRKLKQAELNEILWREARAGKGWAVKILAAQMASADAEEAYQPDAQPAQARAAKLGKKEELALAAERVAEEGVYATPAPPKLVVNNSAA